LELPSAPLLLSGSLGIAIHCASAHFPAKEENEKVVDKLSKMKPNEHLSTKQQGWGNPTNPSKHWGRSLG